MGPGRQEVSVKLNGSAASPVPTFNIYLKASSPRLTEQRAPRPMMRSALTRRLNILQSRNPNVSYRPTSTH